MRIVTKIMAVMLICSSAVVGNENSESLAALVKQYVYTVGADICLEERYLECLDISYSMCSEDIRLLQSQCFQKARKVLGEEKYAEFQLGVYPHFVDCLIERHPRRHEDKDHNEVHACLAGFNKSGTHD